MQLFLYWSPGGKKKNYVRRKCIYTIHCIDNPFVCIVLVLLCSFCKSSVCFDKVSCIGYWRSQSRTCFSGSLIACLLENIAQVPCVNIKTIIYWIMLGFVYPFLIYPPIQRSKTFWWVGNNNNIIIGYFSAMNCGVSETKDFMDFPIFLI